MSSKGKSTTPSKGVSSTVRSMGGKAYGQAMAASKKKNRTMKGK